MEGMNVYNKKNTKGKIYTSLSLSLLLTLSAPIITRADSSQTGSPEKNSIYVQLINYAMPLVKSVSFSEDDIAEYNSSLKNKLMQLLGIDTTNPLSIIGRELSFLQPLDTGNTNTENALSFFINPFKLSEASVIKNQTSDTSNQNTNMDTNANNNSNDGVTIPNISTASVYNPKLKKTLNASKPEVFIYHTHTTESYQPYAANVSNNKENVVAVGDVLSDELEKNYGIAVVHDKTYHNLGNFLESYARSGETVDKYLKTYKDFKVILDIHRDGGPAKSTVTFNSNNTSIARFLFVIGPGNPNKAQNISLAKKLVGIGQSIFPGLIRPGNQGDYGIYYHNAGTRFNQQKSGNALLVEIGSENNTIEEAKTTGIYLARILAEYINGK